MQPPYFYIKGNNRYLPVISENEQTYMYFDLFLANLIFGVVSFEEATNTLAIGQFVNPLNNIKFAVN